MVGISEVGIKGILRAFSRERGIGLRYSRKI